MGGCAKTNPDKRGMKMSTSSIRERSDALLNEIRNPHKLEPMSTSLWVACLGVCALGVAMQGLQSLRNMHHANTNDLAIKQRIHRLATHAILGLSAVAISPVVAAACGSVALSAILAGVTFAAAAYTFRQVYQISQENIVNADKEKKKSVTISYISVTAVTVLSLTGCYLAGSRQ